MKFARLLVMAIALVASNANAAPATCKYWAACLRHPVIRIISPVTCPNLCADRQPVQAPANIKPFVGPTLD